jgi:hypothetical protein
MKIQLLALPALLLVMGQVAQAADVVPVFTDLTDLNNSGVDYTFDQTGLHGSFSQSGTGWTLNLTGTGNSAFYTPNATGTQVSNVYTVPSSSYNLTASFDASGGFTGGFVQIKGTAPANVPGANYTYGNNPFPYLYDANLVSFSYSAKQAALGFGTEFNPDGWSTQFNGNGNDAVYLFTPGGVLNGSGPLSGLIHGLSTGHLTAATLNNIESLAAVPLPSPVILFGTGLTAFFGFARKRQSQTQSI